MKLYQYGNYTLIKLTTFSSATPPSVVYLPKHIHPSMLPAYYDPKQIFCIQHLKHGKPIDTFYYITQSNEWLPEPL